MTNRLTGFGLKKIHATDYMSESEYENVHYFLEVFFINVFKLFQVYLCAFFFGTLFETFVMNCAYILLRRHANGWHANSSFNCSLLGISFFVGIPLLLQKTMVTFSGWLVSILSILLFLGVWRYAPADTEKNPLVSVSERKRKRHNALFMTLILILLSYVIQNQSLQTLILSGLVIEIIMIHPLFYKLTKRSYKNYEKYVTEK